MSAPYDQHGFPETLSFRTGRSERETGGSLFRSRFLFRAGLAAFVWFCIAGQPADARPRRRADAFVLVFQAMRAKRTLVFVACQDILFAAPANRPGPSTRIVADIVRAGRRSRITYRQPATVANMVVADDGLHLRQYEPAHRALMVGSSAAADASSAQMAVLLRRNYECRRLGGERVNARACDVVELRPRFQPGPLRRCWIDRRNHALLRTEEYDGAGHQLYVSTYRTIVFPRRLPAGALSLPRQASGLRPQAVTLRVQLVSFQQAFGRAGIHGRLPAWSPRGYTLVGCSLLRRGTTRRAAVLRYSDGLKTFSIAEEASTRSLPTAQRQQEMLDRRLARYGQQAWVRDCGRLRLTVLADMTLPSDLGGQMLSALDPRSEARLGARMVRDFGAGAAGRARQLRRAGWGYEQIAALHLCLRREPQAAARIHRLLAGGVRWPEIARPLHGDATAMETVARAWVVAALSGHD